MKIKEIIEFLKQMPQEKELWYVWDGEARSKIDVIWQARNGNIIASEASEIVYSEEDRPINAPSEKEASSLDIREFFNIPYEELPND